MVSGQETTRLVLKAHLAGESKADAADFILKQLIDDKYLRKIPFGLPDCEKPFRGRSQTTLCHFTLRFS